MGKLGLTRHAGEWTGWHPQRGLSMVELLVVLALSAVLLAGVADVYVGMRQSERMQQSSAEMQDAGRFALDLLARDIRMAGYVGCLSALDEDEVNNTLDGPPPSFEPEKGVQGWEYENTAPGDINNSQDGAAVVSTSGGGWNSSGGNVLEDTNAVPGTDIIRVWSVASIQEGDSAAGRVNSISPGAETVINTNVFDVADGDILLISDCQQADWVQACNVQQNGNPPTLNLTLSDGCTPGNKVNHAVGAEAGGDIVKLGGTQYYIGKRDDDASNPPALFRRKLDNTAALGPAEELVEGVANIQILYGENRDSDNQNTADTYLPADQVGDWVNVVSVRIAVLVQTIADNLAPEPQPYTYHGVTYDGASGNGSLPDDRRLRRVFTTTLSVRNRSL